MVSLSLIPPDVGSGSSVGSGVTLIVAGASVAGASVAGRTVGVGAAVAAVALGDAVAVGSGVEVADAIVPAVGSSPASGVALSAGSVGKLRQEKSNKEAAAISIARIIAFIVLFMGVILLFEAKKSATSGSDLCRSKQRLLFAIR